MKDTREKLNEFLEKEFGNPSNSRVMKEIAALSEEGKSIQANRERMEQGFQMQFKQRTGIIDRQYQVKMDALKAMEKKMKDGSMTKADILNLKVAIDELLQLLEVKKERELETTKNSLEERNQSMAKDFEEKSEQKVQEHLDALSKLEKEFAILENNYETASFGAPIWNKLSHRSLFPELNGIRLGEKQIGFDFGDKRSVYSVPQIVPFFTKKSLLITYNEQQRGLLENVFHSIMVRSLMSADPGNILYYLMDGDGNGSLFLGYRKCEHANTLEIFNNKLFTTPSAIEYALGDIDQAYSDIDQNRLRGDCIEDFNKQNPKTSIPYRIVVFDHFPNGVRHEYLAMIARLAEQEIRSGLHFVFLMEDKEKDYAKAIVESPAVHCVSVDDIELNSFGYALVQKVMTEVDNRYSIDKSMLFAQYYTEENVKWWNDTTANYTRIPVGVGKTSNYDLVFNEEGRDGGMSSANAIICGSPGCGKSSLLHTLIMGASIRYSPDELHFVLVDMKAVEFKMYEVEKLPHAELVATQADPEFGLHILKLMCNKIKERERLLSEKGAKNYLAFRNKYPDEKLPRYIIIIDEYQELFRNDRMEVIDYLDMIVRVGRAMGFNLILSSQNVEVPSELAGNISHRIAMRCTTEMSRSMLNEYVSDTPSLKTGQFIIHADTKEKVQSYYLPDDDQSHDDKILDSRPKYLKEIRRRWLEKKGNDYEDFMMVFDRVRPALLKDNRAFRKLRKWTKGQKFWFSPGEKVMIDGVDLMREFAREKNENLLIVGGKRDVAVRALNGIVMSMQPQLGNEVRLDVLNLAPFDDNRTNMRAVVDASGGKYSENGSDLEGWLNEIVADMENRQEGDSSAPRFLVIYCAERCEELHGGINTVSYDTVYVLSEYCEKLNRILTEGSEKGIHCLVHFTDYDGYSSVFGNPQNFSSPGFEARATFKHRLLLQMDETSSAFFLDSGYSKNASTLVNSQADEKNAFNLALYYNTERREEIKIKPYDYYSLT